MFPGAIAPVFREIEIMPIGDHWYFLLALSTCASPGIAAAQDTSRIDGEWTTDCLTIGKDGRHGYITRIAIEGNKVSAVSQIYAKNACRTPTVQVRYTGSISVSEAEGGALNVENVVGTITTTPHIQDVVEHYNRPSKDAAGCGLTSWKENVPMSVAGRTFGPFSFAAEGARLYDMAWIDGNRLRLGAFPANWSNTSADKRPTKPIDVIYYRTGK